MSLFEELKRRNVFRVGIAYAVAAWLILQLTEVLTELLELDTDVGKIVILLLVVGFIPALIFAWAFELTPEGIKREKEVDRSHSVTHQTGRRLDFGIIAMLVLALGYFAWDEMRDLARSAETKPLATSAPAVGEGASEATPETSAPTSSETAIAVLPFADLSQEGDQEYFADGISEELLNLLVRVEGLKVASRTSSFAYKGSSLGIADIARDLKVDHVLEGSVRKADNRVRITAQLIDTTTDRHLWSETFDRELDDIFAIQDEIANAIVEALRSELGVLDDAGPVQVAQDTENLDAYELYLTGRSLFMARADIPESIRLLEQSVALDPGFARAWEALSAVYGVAQSWNVIDRDYGALALEAAERALQLNPELSMPYAVMGLVRGTNQGHVGEALTALDTAIENDPLNATAWHWRGLLWNSLGFTEKAIRDLQECLDLDPRYLNCQRYLAAAHLINGEKDRALELFTLGAEAGYPGFGLTIAKLFLDRGDRLGAALALWTTPGLERTYPASDVLDALADPGSDQSARRARFLDWVDRTESVPDMRTATLALLGAYDRIEILADDTTAWWMWLPEYEKFRTTTHFKHYVRQIGMPEYWATHGYPDRCRPVGEDDFECE